MKWFILLMSMLKLAYSQTFDCGEIGNPLARSQNTVRRSVSATQVSAAFYLDTNNSASCSGNVTRWRYCYFPSQADLDAPPSIQFAVYRLNQTTNSYDRVSRVYTAFGVDDIDATVDCQILQLGQNQFAQVQTGDVIGACIYRSTSNSSPLDVIGRGITGQSSLMQGGTCSFNSLPVSVTNLFITRDGLVMLIYADQIFQNMPPVTDGVTTVTMVNPVTTVNPTLPLGTGVATQNPLIPATDDPEFEADLGLRDNSTMTETHGSINLGIVTAIVVVVLLAVTLGAVVMIFVYLVTRHCKKSKTINNDSETNTSSAYSNLEVSSHPYDFPSLTGSMKLEQRELEVSTKEHIYDYARVRAVHVLERSEYVSMENDMGLDPAYSLVEDSNSRMDFSSHLERNKQEDIYGSVGIYAKPASVETELYAQLKTFGIGSIPVESIRVTGHLGSGYFGQVKQGVWISGGKEVDVAMKTLNKQVVRDEDQIKFLQEAAIMAQFRHPNIVTLYGITYKEEPLMLVLELVDRGNLKDYLLFLKPTPGEKLMDNLPRLLLKFSQQVALGMQYLSARGYIHRDLAARNVLVNKYGICKITDFGMSRDLADENYYVANNRDAIPVKWTAPEALYYKKYSTASDVWSYGCLLYEIWSLGHTPFEELSNREVIRKISSGIRPGPPPGTPKSIYEMMIRCWHPNTTDRPKFREMVLVLIGEEDEVLFIPPEAASSHRMAGTLGSPLDTGMDMYPELEMTYIKDT